MLSIKYVHEKALREDPWIYFKNLCSSGTSSLSPICSSDEAFAYFSNTAKESSFYQSLPPWIDEVWPAPDPELYFL